MSSRRSLLKSATALVAASMIWPRVAFSDEPLPVVATFSILGDMVERIGGDHISLTTLVGPDGDAHVYQPTPQDAAAVAGAQVLFMNGLEFEGWLERLAEAAPFEGETVVATVGVDLIAYDDDHDDDDEHGHDDHDDHDDHAEGEKHDHDDHDDHAGHDHDDHEEDHAEDEKHDHDHEEHAEDDHDKHEEDHAGHDHDDHEEHAEGEKHDDHDEDHAGHDHDDHKEEHAGHDHAGHDHGAFDPHTWQTIENALVYVDNITAGLAKADPDNAGAYYANRAAYVEELTALDAEIEAMMAAIPEDKRTVVTSHDAFGYLAEHFGMTFAAPQGLSTESEASAADVAALITQIREEGISAVFVEKITDNRLIEQIANETGAGIGGTLFSDALSGEDGPASTYIDMMRHNAQTLSAALSGS